MTFARHPLLSDVFAYVGKNQARLFREDEAGADQVEGALAAMPGNTAELSGLAFTPDEQYLVSLSDAPTLKVWLLKDQSCDRTIDTGHRE